MILKGRLENNLPTVIILQENPATFTIGSAGSRENLLATPQELVQRGIEVLAVNRGGDITYHGPGQLIASPLFFLGDIQLNANAYLHRLEDVLIEMLAVFGIKGGKQAELPGVWVDGEKIAAVGIAVRRGFTFHGLSLNVNLDLVPFSWINPCGIPKMRVTSMQQILGEPVPLDKVKIQLKQAFASTFNLQLQDSSWAQLKSKYRFPKGE